MEAGREAVLMQATFKVYRHDPEAGRKTTLPTRPLETPPEGTGPAREHMLRDEQLQPVRNAMRCYYCGLCDEGCSVIPFDNTFLGPAALTKAYRFVFDPRDGARAHRLQAVGEPRGMWDCVHCFEADEHCPRGIDPTHRIMDLRDKAVGMGIKAGSTKPPVAPHYDGFAPSVKTTACLALRRCHLATC